MAFPFKLLLGMGALALMYFVKAFRSYAIAIVCIYFVYLLFRNWSTIFSRRR